MSYVDREWFRIVDHGQQSSKWKIGFTVDEQERPCLICLWTDRYHDPALVFQEFPVGVKFSLWNRHDQTMLDRWVFGINAKGMGSELPWLFLNGLCLYTLISSKSSKALKVFILNSPELIYSKTRGHISKGSLQYGTIFLYEAKSVDEFKLNDWRVEIIFVLELCYIFVIIVEHTLLLYTVVKLVVSIAKNSMITIIKRDRVNPNL